MICSFLQKMSTVSSWRCNLPFKTSDMEELQGSNQESASLMIRNNFPVTLRKIDVPILCVLIINFLFAFLPSSLLSSSSQKKIDLSMKFLAALEALALDEESMHGARHEKYFESWGNWQYSCGPKVGTLLALSTLLERCIQLPSPRFLPKFSNSTSAQ